MARINDKFIFLEIQKTGSIWVRHAMTNAGIIHREPKIKTSRGFWFGNSHIGLDWIDEDINKFKFAFIRHPLTWYQSYYCFRKFDHPLQARTTITDILFKDNFEEYVENCLSQFPNGLVTAIYKNFLGYNGKRVDFLGKQENLADDLVKALNLAGVKFDEDKLRDTPKVNLSLADLKDKSICQYSEKLEKKVLKAERWIVKHFYEI